MIPKPVDQIRTPDRADYCNGEGYVSPTETAALRNVYREAYRAPASQTQRYFPPTSAKPQLPRVNAATTVQLEQELIRRKAEERKRKEQDKAYNEGRKKARQVNIILGTLCDMAGLKFVGEMKLKDKATGDVFGKEDFQTQKG